MKEKIDELYEQYLNEKLDLIFQGEVGKVSNERIRINVLAIFCKKNGYEIIKYFIPHKLMLIKNADGKYNLLNKEGKLVSPTEWYDEIDDFHCGVARVKKDNKYNFINPDGKLRRSNKWYDFAYPFRDNCAYVELEQECTCIHPDGGAYCCWYPIGDDYVDSIRSADHKKTFKKYRHYGEEIEYFHSGSNWYRYRDYTHKPAYNFISNDNKLINENEWFHDIELFENGYAMVETVSYGWKYIDTEGNFYDIDWHENDYSSFLSILSDYKIKRVLFGYICQNGINSFKLKYKPYYIFNSNYVLCISRNIFYLYNKQNDKYEKLGNIGDIYVSDNFIVDKKNDKVWMIYNNQKVDITKYYHEKLISKNLINIVNGVNINRILSKEEFALYNIEEIERILEEERKNNQKIKEEQRKQKQLEDLEKAKEQEKMEEEQRKQIEMNTLKSIQQALSVLQQVSSPSKTVTRINVDNIFIPVDDHLEIINIIATMLRFVDLSWIRFDNVKVSGLDFSYSNIKFNPQTIYNKDLSNCNFEGVHIEPFMNFTGVDIRGTKFSDDDDIKTIDFFNGTFQYAIYDENTTYNGRPFTEIFSKETKQTKGGK